MERNARCLYGGKMQSPCLQTFVVAPSAAGKGILGFVRLLIEPIHDEIRRQVEQQMSAYKKAKSSYNAMGKERSKMEEPEMPPNRMFIISGNNTGTGILQNIMDSNGTGLICESEADTVSTAIGTEYGNWSDTLRKAFDHDRLSYNRRTDREYKETTACYLSVLLSGTPAQIKPLISSPENGQFSRNIFYYMPRVGEWKDQFGEDELDVEAEFIRMGHEWKASRDELKKKGLFTLKFTVNIRNSLIIAGSTTVVAIIISSLAAYGVVRFFPKLGNVMTKILVTTYMFPSIMLVIPYAMVMAKLNLTNTRIGLMLVYLSFSVPYAVWMLVGFFKTVPIGIEEAARIDGANKLQVFIRIVLPLVSPGIVATAIYVFINAWNEYLYSMILMSSSDKTTISVAVKTLEGADILNWGSLMAACAIVVVPVHHLLLLYPK